MPFLSRGSLVPVALFAAGALSVVGYGYVTREMSGATSSTQTAQSRGTSARLLPGQTGRLFRGDKNASTPGDPSWESSEAPGDSLSATDGAASTSRSANAAGGTMKDGAAAAPPNGKAALAATPENVATWIAEATGSDAAKKATAIEALGTAPKGDAVPVLAQVLETADDADSPRALRSLRTLAQREGDSDDRIRSVVRKIIFHADDEASTQAAQAMLDEIERDLSQPGAKTR